MKLDNRTLEEILAGKPDCFAIPHEFAPWLKKCESCAVRQACVDTSAQMFTALSIGLIKGKTIASVQYGADARNIVSVIQRNAKNHSALHPCNHAKLPELFERAMHAYAIRSPEPNVDELLADLDDSESHDEIGVMSVTTKETVNVPHSRMIEDVDDDMPIEFSAEEQARQLIGKLNNGKGAAMPMQPDNASPNPSTDSDAASACRDMPVPARSDEPLACSPTSTSHSESGRRTAILSPLAGFSSLSSYSLAGATRLDHYRTIDDKSLIDALRKIYDCVQHHGIDYRDVREDYCAINRVMNERKLSGPGWRPYLAPPHKSKKYTEAQKLLANDRRMFDIEWLHRLGYPNELDDPAFADLLCADELDYDLAASFVTMKWTGTQRVNILSLSPAEQRPLGMFLSDEVRKLIKETREKSRKIRMLLKNRMIREKKLLPFIDDYVRLWIATQLCSGELQSSIGQMYGWQKGERPPAPSTLSSKLKILNRLLHP